jgi:hypothetical protein
VSILGVGACPIGSTGAGIGAFSQVSSSASRLFLKDDGTQGNAAYLNPATLDYELDERGVEKGADSTQMKVQAALFTQRNRSSLDNFGLDLTEIQTIPVNVVRVVDAMVRESLVHLTSASLITIMSVDVERFEQTGVSVHIKWVDIETGQFHTESIFP